MRGWILGVRPTRFQLAGRPTRAKSSQYTTRGDISAKTVSIVDLWHGAAIDLSGEATTACVNDQSLPTNAFVSPLIFIELSYDVQNPLVL